MISFKKVIWLFPNKLNLKLIDNQKVSPGNFCFPDSQSLFQISDFKSHDLKRLLFFRVKLFAIHWSVEMWKRRKRKHFYMKWTCYTLNSPGLNFFSRFFWQIWWTRVIFQLQHRLHDVCVWEHLTNLGDLQLYIIV